MDVTRWVKDAASTRDDASFDLVDLKEVNLPLPLTRQPARDVGDGIEGLAAHLSGRRLRLGDHDRRAVRA
ncbi:hypothetical protein Lesp01_33550 [Lentzea sp. NBRC 102530]|nr:hypothetical protein Lesp01_33550 [Lentzea sp. NBRC 102530]